MWVHLWTEFGGGGEERWREAGLGKTGGDF